MVYDRVNKWGGAERLLLVLHELFPEAPLYTSVYNKKKASWAEVFDVRTSFLQGFPLASSSHEFYPLLMPLAFESFSFDKYDLVISVTSEAAKGIITKPKTLHVCYCLTPTRYLWSGYEDYFRSKIFRVLSSTIISYLRAWDKVAAQRPDVYIALSKEVQKRIRKYYGRKSEVVYPPISLQSTVDSLQQDKKAVVRSRSTERFFLIVSRLVPYKRIDIAVEAFNKLKLPLKIIGTGSQERKLRAMAGPTIEFLGNLTDAQLVGYYKNCRALIFPGYEDFGLATIEAQSFGKPVIAYGDGGALETVVEGKTGVFFYEQTSDSLMAAVNKFLKAKFNPDECKKQAQNFNMKRFKEEFIQVIKRLV